MTAADENERESVRSVADGDGGDQRLVALPEVSTPVAGAHGVAPSSCEPAGKACDGQKINRE